MIKDYKTVKKYLRHLDTLKVLSCRENEHESVSNILYKTVIGYERLIERLRSRYVSSTTDDAQKEILLFAAEETLFQATKLFPRLLFLDEGRPLNLQIVSIKKLFNECPLSSGCILIEDFNEMFPHLWLPVDSDGNGMLGYDYKYD
jgi:hypothetical protein